MDYNPDRVYNLHPGPNLISFPDTGSVDIETAIHDSVKNHFSVIISEGVAAINTDEYGWTGSLTGFQGGTGYWVIVDSSLSFSFSYDTDEMLARSAHTFVEELPADIGFNVSQSSMQAFYFVDEIVLKNDEIEPGDWLLSYNDDVLAGIRQWTGDMVDIPTMGVVGDELTAGYFDDGDLPVFKVLKQSTGQIIELVGDIPVWESNGVFVLGKLTEVLPLPDEFSLGNAYPNPFNPATKIQFGLPIDMKISIDVYDLNGKFLETLIERNMLAGYHSIIWNASSYSSGIYFMKMQAGSYIRTQKLMLIK